MGVSVGKFLCVKKYASVCRNGETLRLVYRLVIEDHF